MSEKDFNIESRLCAYIDGLLDAEQREQIEQYLDRYPEHRQLVDQLMQERALLRDMPREAAPADVLAHFQWQLERSVLLNDLSTVSAGGRNRRRGRWNLAVFLTTLLLLAGLGVIVWIAMPPQRGIRKNYIAEPNTPPGAPVATTEPSAATEPVAPPSAASKPSSQPVPAASPPQILASVVNAGDRTIVMVFSDDLGAAENRADQFLKVHGLSRLPPVGATQPATTQSDTISPATESIWQAPGMTIQEAGDLAASLSAQPAPAAAHPATQSVAPPRPTTQVQATTEPASAILIHFQKLDFSPKNGVNPNR